ncbi:MAG: cold shock and DUF1294 domain-containing protein [Betaproteobacteria bacterium]
MSTSARFDGAIKTWNDERGFGFIELAQGGQEVFVHIKAFDTRGSRPQVGQLVSFEVEPGPQGKKRAKRVQPVQVRRVRVSARRQSSAQSGTAKLFAIPAFLVLFLVVHLLWRPPLLLGGTYVGLSLVAFIMYALDKSAARRGAWRTPEKTLHMLSLLGGWPGALLAQQFLRHKSTKAEFRAVFWGTVVLNVAGFVALCSPMGRTLWAH